jgi:hypothetical protein
VRESTLVELLDRIANGVIVYDDTLTGDTDIDAVVSTPLALDDATDEPSLL